MRQDTMRTGTVLQPMARGFTLVEMLVVISIIVILVAIAFPAIGGARTAARLATTRTLQSSVLDAIQTYRTEHGGALPGYFSQDQMGDPDNATRGFTQMENAILILAGGVEPSVTTADPTEGRIEVGPTNSPSGQAIVVTGLIGDAEGPGYLSLDDAYLAPVEGQVTQGTGAEQMPDVLDAFGNPMLLWMRNELAPADAEFASGNRNTAAEFYLVSNAGYLSSNSLGKESRNQAKESLLGLGGGLGPSASPQQIRTMEALLGSPAQPDPDDPSIPAAARGDVVIQSAGPDGIYLSNDGEKITEAAYRGSSNDSRAIDQFDDLISARN